MGPINREKGKIDENMALRIGQSIKKKKAKMA